MGGGFFGGQIRVFAGQEGPGVPAVDTVYNLIVAPRATGQFGGFPPTVMQWKTSTASDANPPSQNQVYGKLATDAFTGTTYPAFNWAKGLNIGGFTDWYIPAKNELDFVNRYFLARESTAQIVAPSIPKTPSVYPRSRSVF
jgi:hypothetical protein